MCREDRCGAEPNVKTKKGVERKRGTVAAALEIDTGAGMMLPLTLLPHTELAAAFPPSWA